MPLHVIEIEEDTDDTALPSLVERSSDQIAWFGIYFVGFLVTLIVIGGALEALATFLGL